MAEDIVDCDSETSNPLYGIPYLGKEGPKREFNTWQVG